MMDRVYIWRDPHDRDMFMLGIRLSNTEKFCGWVSIHIDAISDLFGEETYNLARDIGTEPMPVNLSMERRLK